MVQTGQPPFPLSNEPPPRLALPPLPPLDRIQPEHITYVRSVVERLSVRPKHWHDDLVQDVLIEAYRSRGSPLAVRALLFGITRHLVSRWKANQRTERTRLSLLPRPAPFTERAPEDEWMEFELRQAVRSAIDELPALLREVLLQT